MALLPSRYTPETNERIIREAARILAGAATPGRPPRRPRAALAAVLFPAVTIVGLGFLERDDPHGSGVPFDRSSVISADVTGTTAKLQDFLYAQGGTEKPRFAEAVEPHAEVSPTSHVRFSATDSASRPRPTARTDYRASSAKTTDDVGATEVVFDENATPFREPVSPPPAPAASSPSLINVGTRIPVILTHDVVTGTGPAPVSARVESDAMADSGVALPKGALVVGEGFSIDESDRVQVVFSALVVKGKTVALQGLALGVDDDLGLPGKVVRKTSKGRGGAGRALGALGGAASTLSFGLLGPKPALVDLTAAELAQQASRDVQAVSRQWSLSDKVVRLAAGTRGIVYLRADLQLP